MPIARKSVGKFAPKEPVMSNFYFSPCPQDRNTICFHLSPDSAPVGTSLSALIWRTLTLIFWVCLPFLAIVPVVEATRSYPDSSNCESQEEEFPGSFCKQLYFLPGILLTKGEGCPRRWPIWLSFPGTVPVLALRFPKKNPSVLGKLAHPTTVWS